MTEIISLIDNISKSNELKHEHGLSFYVKNDNFRFLLDTGASNNFIMNAEILGIDLSMINGIVISHNHSDHIGGLASILDINKDVKVYIKGSSRSKFYYKWFMYKEYIGEEEDLFEKYKDRFIFFNNDIKISENIHLLSNRIFDDNFVCKDKNLLEKKKKSYVLDKFDHELFVLIEEHDKLIILSSCSHNGIVNIVNTAMEISAKPISNIIGGFHLMGFGIRKLNCSKEHVKMISEILLKKCTDEIYTCHCTGEEAYKIMRENIGDKIEYFGAGSKIVL